MKLRDTEGLRVRLRKAGLSDAAIDAAWPDWWSAEAEASSSARTELRLTLSRRLGLDPRSLLSSDEPHFFWRGAGRFKNLRAESEAERDAMTSFGRAAGAMLVGATPVNASLEVQSASDLRALALDPSSEFVRLLDLLSLCWGVGIPVIHLRVFPLPQKRMAAMAVRLGDRTAILLGKDSNYPAPIAFYLAHEIGHIALGHVGAGGALIDLDRSDREMDGPTDAEEREADAFALELLTGLKAPQISSLNGRHSASELARVALASARDLRIEPGIIALCFGYETGDWASANAALGQIYREPKPVWREVNAVATSQLDFSLLGQDADEYLAALLGARE